MAPGDPGEGETRGFAGLVSLVSQLPDQRQVEAPPRPPKLAPGPAGAGASRRRRHRRNPARAGRACNWGFLTDSKAAAAPPIQRRVAMDNTYHRRMYLDLCYRQQQQQYLFTPRSFPVTDPAQRADTHSWTNGPQCAVVRAHRGHPGPWWWVPIAHAGQHSMVPFPRSSTGDYETRCPRPNQQCGYQVIQCSRGGVQRSLRPFSLP
jgi:hypothetical protein